jgi:predicted nucleic acid-binding Zn ribbon protein
MMKPCVICGIGFQSRNMREIYCSACRGKNHSRSAKREASKVMRACVNCGVTFRCAPRLHTITCSRACSIKHSRARESERRAKNRNNMHKTCIICGGNFTSSRAWQITCSETCRITYKRESDREYHTTIQSMHEASKMMRACVVCNATFSPRNSLNTYCSKACFVEQQKMRQREWKVKNRAYVHERDRKYWAEHPREKRQHWQKHYAKNRVRYAEKYQERALAYAVLKALGTAPDYLSTRDQRQRFSYRIMKQHFPRALPASKAEGERP